MLGAPNGTHSTASNQGFESVFAREQYVSCNLEHCRHDPIEATLVGLAMDVDSSARCARQARLHSLHWHALTT